MMSDYRIPKYEEIRVGKTLYTSDLKCKIVLRTIDDLVHFLLAQNYYVDSYGNETYGIIIENYLIEK